MNIVHVYVKFEDTFSFATTTKIVTVDEPKFEKMKQGIGATVNHFDKVQQIHYNFKVKEVRQAKPEDYK